MNNSSSVTTLYIYIYTYIYIYNWKKNSKHRHMFYLLSIQFMNLYINWALMEIYKNPLKYYQIG